MNLFKLYDFEHVFGFIFTDLTLQEIENLKIEYKILNYTVDDFIKYLMFKKPNNRILYINMEYIDGIYF